MILLIILARECYNMLITKARLRQIIKEELESLKEKDALPGEALPPEATGHDFWDKSLTPVIIQREANDAFSYGIIDRAMLDRLSNTIQGFRQIKKPNQRDLDKFAAARVELKKALDSASPDRLAKWEGKQADRKGRGEKVRPTMKDHERALAKSQVGKPTSMVAADPVPKP